MDKEQTRIFYRELSKYGISDWWDTVMENETFWYPKGGARKYIYSVTPILAIVGAFPFNKVDKYPMETIRSANDNWINLCFMRGWLPEALNKVSVKAYKSALDICWGMGVIQPDYLPTYDLPDIYEASSLLQALKDQGKWIGVIDDSNYDRLSDFVSEGLQRKRERELAEKKKSEELMLKELSADQNIPEDNVVLYSKSQFCKFSDAANRSIILNDYSNAANNATKMIQIASSYLNANARKCLLGRLNKVVNMLNSQTSNIDEAEEEKEECSVASIEDAASTQSIDDDVLNYRLELKSDEILVVYNEVRSRYTIRFSKDVSDDIKRIGMLGYTLLVSADRSKMSIRLSKEGLHGEIKARDRGATCINNKKLIYTLRKFFGINDAEVVMRVGKPEVTSEYIKFEILK